MLQNREEGRDHIIASLNDGEILCCEVTKEGDHTIGCLQRLKGKDFQQQQDRDGKDFTCSQRLKGKDFQQPRDRDGKDF